MVWSMEQCKIKPTTLVSFFLFASDPCGKLASGGSDPCGRLASGGSDTSGELASGGSDPSGELASGGLCFELHFALQQRNSEYYLPWFILLSQFGLCCVGSGEAGSSFAVDFYTIRHRA